MAQRFTFDEAIMWQPTGSRHWEYARFVAYPDPARGLSSVRIRQALMGARGSFWKEWTVHRDDIRSATEQEAVSMLASEVRILDPMNLVHP